MNSKRSIFKFAVFFGFVFASLCGALRIEGATNVDTFKEASQLYDAGRFSEAAALFDSIHPKTASVHFNLGNAFFRDGQIGRAILNYERARRLAPRDPDILANLRFAQDRLGLREINASPSALRRFLHEVVFSRTLREWCVYEVLAVWLTAVGIGVYIFTRKARAMILIFVLSAFVWLGLTVLALGYRVVEERTSPKAIVVVNNAETRFAPLPDSTVHFQLSEGTRVAVKEDRGQWAFIERADGQQGWVRRETLEPIEPSISQRVQ